MLIYYMSAKNVLETVDFEPDPKKRLKSLNTCVTDWFTRVFGGAPFLLARVGFKNCAWQKGWEKWKSQMLIFLLITRMDVVSAPPQFSSPFPLHQKFCAKLKNTQV